MKGQKLRVVFESFSNKARLIRVLKEYHQADDYTKNVKRSERRLGRDEDEDPEYTLCSEDLARLCEKRDICHDKTFTVEKAIIKLKAYKARENARTQIPVENISGLNIKRSDALLIIVSR